jgi:hypothetical protein
MAPTSRAVANPAFVTACCATFRYFTNWLNTTALRLGPSRGRGAADPVLAETKHQRVNLGTEADHDFVNFFIRPVFIVVGGWGFDQVALGARPAAKRACFLFKQRRGDAGAAKHVRARRDRGVRGWVGHVVVANRAVVHAALS